MLGADDPSRSLRTFGALTVDTKSDAAQAARPRAWKVGAIVGWLARRVAAAVVLVLTLVGFFFLTRGSAVRSVRGVGVDALPVAPGEPEFPLAVAVLTGTVLGSAFAALSSYLIFRRPDPAAATGGAARADPARRDDRPARWPSTAAGGWPGSTRR